MGGATQLLGGVTTMFQNIVCFLTLFLLSGEVQTSHSLSIPVFSVQPTDDIIALGSQAELRCQITGDPNPTYNYSHNNSVLGNDDKTGRVIISDGSLIIKNFTASDAGQYFCTADYTQGTVNSRTATLRTAYIADSFSTYPTSQTLVTHTSFSISCAIDSLPDADIMFFQDSVLLNVSSITHLTTTKISKGIKLNINDVQFSDAGDFYCGAINSINSGYVTGTTITITVQGPPEFVQVPQSLSIPEALDARLDCVVVGVPTPVLSWRTPGGSSIPSTSSPRFSVASNNSLVISNVQKSDAGFYTCSASNKFGSPFASSRLTVLDPLSKPSFTTSPNDLTILVNSSIIINCVASGNPSPTVMWEKDGDKLAYNSRVTFLPIQGVLRITSVRVEDDGRYKCVAVNSQGSVTAQAVVTVQVPPSINSTLSDLVLDERAPLMVHCTATGKPSPIITFSYPSTANVVTKVPGRLRVVSLGRSDAGDYSCTAKNAVGQDKKHFNLRVQGGPYFIRKPNNVAATTGTTVTFYCDVAGDPLPTKNWTRTSRTPLPKDPRYSIVSTGELQIKHIVSTDAGLYECRGSNRFGDVVASATLSVNVFPSFTQRPEDIEVTQGNTATFECLATGSPSPTYSWTFPNGTVIKSDSLSRFLSDGEMLTIRGLTAADQGRYTCIATNAAGSIASAATVTMLIFPTFTVTPSNAIFIAGQTAKFLCAATGVNKPTISWNLIPAQGQKRPLTSARYSITSTGTLSISTVQKTNEGTYECQATNRAGANTTQARLTVHIRPVAFLTQSTVTVTEGQDTTWRCNISEGDPAPTFKWTQAAGTPLPDTGRFLDSGDGLLTVRSVKREDAGQYRCQATNYVGSSTTTGTLNVQVVPVISFINAKPALLHKATILDCGATGLPEPKIVWKANSIPIPISEKYSQAANGSLIISRAERSDQRAYQCEARNSAGTALQSVALTLILPPGQPTSPVASDEAVNAVTLTWTVSDGGSPITGHNIAYFQDGWSDEPIRVDGNTTQRITGLLGDTEYYFRVQAINVVGPGDFGASSQVVKTSIGGPSAPRSFTARVNDSGSVELTWSSSEFPNGPLRYYEIQYESQDKFAEIPTTTHLYQNISDMHYYVTGLYPYISYIFRIRGNNGGDELWGDYAETTALTGKAVPTVSPQNVQLEAAGTPEIVVSWQPPPLVGRNGPIDSYHIYYRLITEESEESEELRSETKEYQLEVVDGELTSHTLNVEGNSNYGVIMSMVNSEGEGPKTPEVILLTPPVSFPEKQGGDSLGTGVQAAIAVGVICFTLLCLVIGMSFFYRYKMRTAVISMNRRDEELGNDDAVGGGRETGGNGYLPDSPEVRTKNVRGKYRKTKSQKSMTIPVTTTRTDTTDSVKITYKTEPESPRYAEPTVALILPEKSGDSQAVTAEETNAVYAQVEIRSKQKDSRKDELEEQRRQKEAQRKEAQERQKAEIERKKQEEARRKETETRKKKEEKKQRDEEAKRIREMLKRDKKRNGQDRQKAAKKRASTKREYNLSFEADFGSAQIF